MATIEFIEKRIEGKEKEIVKLEKKLQRIIKAKESGWNDNPYYYRPEDERYTLKYLDNAKQALAEYQNDLKVANKKANSRNIPIIIEFLDEWKQRAFDYYKKLVEQYYEERTKVREAYNRYSPYLYGRDEKAKELEAEYDKVERIFNQECNGYYEKQEVGYGQYKSTRRVKVKDGKFEHIMTYVSGRTEQEALNKIEKDLEEEKNRKYDFIIERTQKIVEEITDASDLSIGEKGDLNGFIKGSNGKTAKVQTIGAGGYAVQIFHFRTLINEVH